MKLSKIAGAVLSLGLLLNALPGSAALTTQRLWTLNMKDAELRDLASEVGEITGKTLVVDARLQGKVSVQSSNALTRTASIRCSSACCAARVSSPWTRATGC